MKNWIATATWFGLIILTAIFILNAALSLISAPSDIEVGIGFLMLFGFFGAVAWGILYFWEFIKPFLSKFPIIFVLLFLPHLSGCSQYIKPGEVAIVVDSLGSSKGVEPEARGTGRVWYNPFTTTIYTYPTFIQTTKWEIRNNDDVTYASKDGMVFSADVSISFEIPQNEVPKFYVKFRSDDLHAFEEGFLKNVTRDAFNEVANKYTTEQCYGDKKSDILIEVKDRLTNLLVKQGIGANIVQLGYIGSPRPPESVITSINNKVTAVQEAETARNKVERSKAEADQAIAKADGEAQANKKLNESLTPNLLEWRRLTILQEAVARWNGERPMVEGAGSNLLLSLPSARPDK